jgi:hypothetical protein
MNYNITDKEIYKKVNCSTRFIAEGDKDHIFYLKGNSLGDLIDSLIEIESYVPTHKVYDYTASSKLNGNLSLDAKSVYISTISEFKEFYAK